MSPTLSREMKTAMSKTLKEAALACSICEVEFRTLEKEHEPGVGEDLSKMAGLVLNGPLYKVRRDRKDDHVEYDVFRLSNMNNLKNAIRDVIKTGARSSVL